MYVQNACLEVSCRVHLHVPNFKNLSVLSGKKYKKWIKMLKYSCLQLNNRRKFITFALRVRARAKHSWNMHQHRVRTDSGAWKARPTSLIVLLIVLISTVTSRFVVSLCECEYCSLFSPGEGEFWVHREIKRNFGMEMFCVWHVVPILK